MTRQDQYDYGACHTCGERLEERYIKQDFWLKDTLLIVEDIPAGVCPQCGEKVVKADVGLWVTKLLEDSPRVQKARTIQVPVVRFVEEARRSD